MVSRLHVWPHWLFILDLQNRLLFPPYWASRRNAVYTEIWYSTLHLVVWQKHVGPHSLWANVGHPDFPGTPPSFIFAFWWRPRVSKEILDLHEQAFSVHLPLTSLTIC